MRANPLVQLGLSAAALLALGACSGSANSAASEGNARESPAPLRGCEMRELTLDGVDLVVSSNADGSLASIAIVGEASRENRTRALEEAEQRFGPIRRDDRTTTRVSKWGITVLTDPCGRPITAPPNATASPAASPP